MLVRFAKIGWSGNSAFVTANQWVKFTIMANFVFHSSETEQALVRSGLNRTLRTIANDSFSGLL
jgi:hypothetical protein